MNIFKFKWLTHNWKKKSIAIVTGIVIWFFVNASITTTKTITNVPVRVINLPQEKTISGLLPNGMLGRRITLTLTGTKDVVEEIEPGDLAVLLDASTIEGDEWIVHLSKKNLVSLNPAIDLRRHITQVDHTEFIIELTPLITKTIPIRILPPTGHPPEGYELLDVLPKDLEQTVTGPEEDVERLSMKGLKLIFNLDQISKEQLDKLSETETSHIGNEVIFSVPKLWKKVFVPFQKRGAEIINDPRAGELKIVFLKKSLIQLGDEIPVRIFFPLESSGRLNPETVSVAESDWIIVRNGIPRLVTPLYLKDVSSPFVDIVRDHLEIVITAAPGKNNQPLEWSLDVIDSKLLEDKYINLFAKYTKESLRPHQVKTLQQRFQEYLNRLTLYNQDQQQIELLPHRIEEQIHIELLFR